MYSNDVVETHSMTSPVHTHMSSGTDIHVATTLSEKAFNCIGDMQSIISCLSTTRIGLGIALGILCLVVIGLAVATGIGWSRDIRPEQEELIKKNN